VLIPRSSLQGTPFLNPIVRWDKEHPEDRTQWEAQHNTLKFYDPPCVISYLFPGLSLR
jgi:hypothetical protein